MIKKVEYRTFKPVEIAIRGRLTQKGEKWKG
jgi:hypothetical protein